MIKYITYWMCGAMIKDLVLQCELEGEGFIIVTCFLMLSYVT